MRDVRTIVPREKSPVPQLTRSTANSGGAEHGEAIGAPTGSVA
jgi:hypothetical protein